MDPEGFPAPPTDAAAISEELVAAQRARPVRELLANTKEFASERWDAVFSNLKMGRLPSEVRRALHVRFLLNMEKPLAVAFAATGAGDIIVTPLTADTATTTSSEEIAAIISASPRPTSSTPGPSCPT